MSKNGLESALQSIEYQKKVRKLKFNETLENRKRATEGQLSIAADRGLIKVLTNSSSIGYNSKMKIINDRLSNQIIDKYKTRFSFLSPHLQNREFINKDTINMIKSHTGRKNVSIQLSRKKPLSRGQSVEFSTISRKAIKKPSVKSTNQSIASNLSVGKDSEQPQSQARSPANLKDLDFIDQIMATPK